MADAEAALTLPRPFVSLRVKDEDDPEAIETKNEAASDGAEPRKRRTLEEILAAAEEEFELLETACDAAVKALKSGKEIQRLSAIRNLTNLLETESNYEDVVRRVLPALQEILVNEPSNIDIHCEAAVVFKNIIRDVKYTQKYCGLTDKLLDYILRNLENQKENVTAAAWLESLVEIADSIPTESVVELIVPLAVSQAESTRRVQRRVIAARLVEKLATIIPAEFARRDLAPCAASLCRDSSAAVRTAIVQRLATVAQALSNATECVAVLLPGVMEMCGDEDAGVRETTLNALVTILPHLTKDSRRSVVVPLIRKCVGEALILRDAAALTAVARQLGAWLAELCDVLAASERRWFLDAYRRLCELSATRSGPAASAAAPANTALYLACRRMCAFNFPCFAQAYGDTNFNADLLPLLERFCADTDEEVRVTVAAGFHEIVQLRQSSQEGAGALLAPFVELLCGGSAEVLQHLTGSLDRILPALYAEFDASGARIQNVVTVQLDGRMSGNLTTRRGSIGSTTRSAAPPPSKEPTTRVQLDRILIGCNRVIRGTGAWRSHEAYLRNIAVLRRLVPAGELHADFVPMLQQEILTARALPCRVAAANTLLLMMRELPTMQKRATIIDFFVKEVAGHVSCHRRRILLDAVPALVEHFSCEFFIDTFLPAVLALITDPVSNIRLMLCRTLSLVKTYLSFPAHDAQLSAMERAVGALLAAETNLHTRQLIQEFAVALSRAETADDHGDQRVAANRAKLSEERRLWTEREPTPDTAVGNDLAPPMPPPRDAKPNALRRSATANLADMPVLSEKATVLATSIVDLTAAMASDASAERSAPPRPPAATTAARLPPANWRTSRPDRPKLAVIRPQPQVTVLAQRSPSPMPFGAASGEAKDGADEARRSRLPLSTARYRSLGDASSVPSDSAPRKASLPDAKVSAQSPQSSDSPLKKYRPKTGDSSLPRRPAVAAAAVPPVQYAATRRASEREITGYDVMTRSASTALDGVVGGRRASATTMEAVAPRGPRRPYGLMRVQSTSAVERKPAHMSIRVTSMS